MLRKMTKTTPGSPDGINVRDFEEGETYDLPEQLARAFDSMRVCEKVIDNTQQVKSMDQGAPTNKAEPGSTNDKSEDDKSKTKPEKDEKKKEPKTKPKRRRG